MRPSSSRAATSRLSGARLLAALVVAAVGAVLLVVAWRRLYWSGQVPVDGNMIAFSYPNWALARSVWLKPHLPLWNPARDLGEPHLADPQTMALYPPQLLLSALPHFSDYLRLWVFLHTALAAVFAALLARRWYGDSAAAAAAAVLAGFNGFFMARVTFPNHLAAAAWLPAAAYFLDRESAAGLGVCLAAQWLAGFPPLSLVSGAGLLVMAAAKRGKGLRCFTEATAWALALGAAQWAPFLRMMLQSVRATVLSGAGALQYALPLGQAAKELLLPQWYALRPALSGDPAIVTYYAGLFATLLAVWAAVKGRGRERLLAAVAAAAAALSLRAAGPIADALPLLRVFRFPSNWLLLTAGATTLLAAAGVSRLRASWRWPAVALIAADLLAFAQPAKQAWAQPAFLEEPPRLALAAGAAGGPARLYHDDALMRAWQRGTLRDAGDYALMREFLAPSYGTAFGLQEVASYQVLKPRVCADFAARLDSPERERLLDEAGVSLELSLSSGAEAVTPGALRLRRRERALPRVFSPGAAAGAVSLLDYGPGRARARVNLPGPASVVLAETDYPGWTARVDGRAAPLRRYDGAFVEVEVPAGAHEVDFDFEPRLTFAALAFSAAAALALLAKVCFV